MPRWMIWQPISAFLTDATQGDPIKQQRYDLVLKHSTLEEMWQPLYPAPLGNSPTSPDGLRWFGLSFMVFPLGENTVLIGHRGSQAGYDSFLYLNPKNKKAIVAVFNTAKKSVARQTCQTH